MEVQQQGSNWKNARGVISTTYKPLEAVYPTMTTEALKELDVGRIAHRDAALFMWATDATSRTPSSSIGRGGSGM